MYCLETKDLAYQYSPGNKTLSNIDLKVPAQSIYGFLGPNGAGKTTTMRLILGLLKKQKGEIHIFGDQLERNRTAILYKIGALIETPSFYAHLSATENLRVLQHIYRTPASRIQYVLDITGLGNTAAKPVGRFSLGMKQRFGIAASLLHDPSLLILDEPTNGLDPNGMIEIRELLHSLNHLEGVTIFICSHLLSEIERLATDIGIISKGVLMFQGPLKELQSRAAGHIIFVTDKPEGTLKILHAFDPSTTIREGKVYTGPLTPPTIAAINRLLVRNNIEVYQITSLQENLENIFMNFINAAP